MTNMGYCRFQNTVTDLQDCYDHLWDDLDSEYEEQAKKRLVELCKTIAEEMDDE